MRKDLMKTTALVGMGALASFGIAQSANAGEPMTFTMGGYFVTAFQFQDEDDGPGEPAEGLQDNGVYTDGEVQFTASTELDNGLKITTRIEYEAHNQGGGKSVVDERWMRFTGGFGQLKIGHDDNAAYTMYYQAPGGSLTVGVNSPTFGIPAIGGNAVTSYASLYPGLGSDGNKILYFTPRFNGFQLGISYQPDGSRSESDTAYNTPRDDDEGGQEDIWAFGANYVATVGEVDVVLAVGYVTGESENDVAAGDTVFTTTAGPTPPVGTATATPAGLTGTAAAGSDFSKREDRQQVVAAVQFGFAGFTVGGSYLHDDKGKSGDFDTEGWDIGVSYSTGPWTIGLTYIEIEAETGTGARDDELDAIALTGSYAWADGVSIFAAIKHYDYEAGDGAAADENEATFGIFGVSLSF